MSKADDDARVTGSHTADRATSGGPDMAVRNSSTDVSGNDAEARADADSPALRRSRRAAEVHVDALPVAERDAPSALSEQTQSQPQAPSQAANDGVVRVETPTRRQLRLQQVDGRAVAPVPAADQPADVGRTPLPGGRRDRRRRQHGAQAAPEPGASEPAASEAAPPSSDAVRSGDMSVEEALAARQAIARDAGELLAGPQAAGAADPFGVDLGVLAQQKALADRAAILNARARGMQELSEQDRQRTPPPIDPAEAHNLSIVTPPEFVRVPGSTQSVLRAPTTSHIPIVLSRPRQPESVPPLQVQGSGRADGSAPSTITEPIGARDAFGLDPLDAMTAGLGRLRRVRYLQYSLLVVGATALMTGIIMTVSSLNG
ncbi:hypothetical protein IWX63_001360 [Arthrobacter sp. CAN_A2]|uniref:hypothetical protein n=1 Tax=Arthrobacter sp. CAN_A2 TaxID=2787718 RepID=UPI0018EF9F51